MTKRLSLTILALIVVLASSLRFYRLSSNPPSLYWEEAALGYDAYSILKTGKDFHGHSWPLVAFESFGDYKPSLYFYAAVPGIALFGLNDFSVRLPSAFFGVLTVLTIFLIAKNLYKSDSIALISAGLLAFSPWHLQFSRAGFEANLGLFFICLGVWLLLKNNLVFSALALVLSMYAYHAYRVFIPLFLISLFLIYRQKKFFLTGMLVAFMALPIFFKLNTSEIKQRFNETSAFTSLDPIIKSNQLIASDGGGVIARLVHHRFWQYQDIFLKNYFKHFNFSYLFLSGDSNPRHSTQLVGCLYLIQLPFLALGFLEALKKHKLRDLFLLSWLFLAPVPAGLTLAAPHALRSLALVVPLTVFTALGVARFRKIFIILAAFILLIETSRYLYLYHYLYPSQSAEAWQSGYKEMVRYVALNQGQYSHVYITRSLGRPSIYYWFYTQTDPNLVQSLNQTVAKDQGEYLVFNQIKFQDNDYLPDSLIVKSADSSIPVSAKLVKEIKNLSNQAVFNIYAF